MHTKDFLAAELARAGLHEMAELAAAGYYHDYLSPLDVPCLQLGADLENARTPAARALLKRHLNGEFDASKAEARAWMKSQEGREAMANFILASAPLPGLPGGPPVDDRR